MSTAKNINETQSPYSGDLTGTDVFNHVTGKSVYVDDIPVMEGVLFVKVFDSPLAHGKIKSIDLSATLELPGIVKIFSCKDIPGENQIGGIIPDEDMAELNKMGVGKLFPPGTSTTAIVNYITDWVKSNRNF